MYFWQREFYLPTTVIVLGTSLSLIPATAETVIPAHLQTVSSLREESDIENKRAAVQFELATMAASTALYAIQLREMIIAREQSILQQIERTDALIVNVRESHGIELKQIGGYELYRQKIEQARTDIAANWEQYFAQVPAARERAMNGFNRDTGWFEEYLKPTMCALPYVQAGTVPESALCAE